MKKLLSSLVLASVLAVTTIPTVGCSEAQTVAEVNTILTEATTILTVADPNAAWVPQLKAAVSALQTAETTWQAGGAVAKVDDALNAIVAITAVIPLTAAYSPLIDVLVAGIEAVLAALPASPNATLVMAQVNPHIGRVVIKHHMFHSRSSEFTAAWNQAAHQAGLANAELK
jgi:hypothetical protein